MAKAKEQPVVVKQNEENPEPMEIIASSIIQISEAVKKMNSSRLQPKAIYLLIKADTGLPMSTIQKVLTSAALLESTYIKSK